MKRIISSLLAALFLMPGLNVLAIDDTPDKLNAYDIIKALGMEEKVYDAESKMTRAEFANVLYCMTGMKEGDALVEWNKNYFADEEEEIALKSDVNQGYIFEDVTVDNEYFDVINQMYKRGYVSGVSEKLFEPDKGITFEECVAILMNISGYKKIAEQNGGYPAGYLSKAEQTGLLKGVSVKSGKELTVGEAAELIYNSFDVEVAFEISAGNNEKGYISHEEKTMLSEVYGLYKADGIVTENNLTTLYEKSNLSDDEIKVDDEIYKISAKCDDAWNLIGRRVELYYSIDDNDDKIIEYIAAHKTDDSRTYFAEDGLMIERGKIHYNTEEKEKIENFDAGLPVIYNGIAVAEYDSIREIDKGSITIVENNGEDAVIVIWDYKTTFVRDIDYENRKIYTSYKNGEIIELDSDKYISMIYNKSGEKITFNDIEKSSVLTYAINEQGYFRAYVTSDKISGKVNMLDDEEIKIDNTLYEFSKELLNADNMPVLELGKDIIAFLDVTGEIAWAEVGKTAGEESDGWVDAIFIRSFYGSEEDAYFVRMFNPDGEFKNIQMTENVKFDDEKGITSKKDAGVVSSLLSHGYLRYHLNADGLVDRIELPLSEESDENEDRNHLMKKSSGGWRFDKYTSSFSGQVFTNSKTIMFNIPDDITDEKGYDAKITSNYSFTDWNGYKFTAYTKVKNSPLAEVMILNMSKKAESINSETSFLAVVTDIQDVVNDDNEQLKQVTCMLSTGAIVTYYGEYEKTNEKGESCTVFDVAMILGSNKTGVVEKGDIIRCGSNNVKNPNYMTIVHLIYDANAENPYNKDGRNGYFPERKEKYFISNSAVDYQNGVLNIESGSIASLKGGNPFGVSGNTETDKGYEYKFPQGARYMLGYVYIKQGDLFKVTTQDITQMPYQKSGLPESREYDETGNFSGVYIQDWHKGFKRMLTVTYSGKNVTCKAGKLDDIKTYQTYGGDCSRVLTYQYAGEPWEMIIINEE